MLWAHFLYFGKNATMLVIRLQKFTVDASNVAHWYKKSLYVTGKYSFTAFYFIRRVSEIGGIYNNLEYSSILIKAVFKHVIYFNHSNGIDFITYATVLRFAYNIPSYPVYRHNISRNDLPNKYNAIVNTTRRISIGECSILSSAFHWSINEKCSWC